MREAVEKCKYDSSYIGIVGSDWTDTGWRRRGDCHQAYQSLHFSLVPEADVASVSSLVALFSLIFSFTQSSILLFSSGSGSIIFMVSGCLLYGSDDVDSEGKKEDETAAHRIRVRQRGKVTCFVVKKVLGDGAPVYNDVAGRETHRIPEGFG